MCLPGAPDLTPEQVVERARVHARHAGHDTAPLKATHLAPDHDYAVPHVVDTRTGAVIESRRIGADRRHRRAAAVRLRRRDEVVAPAASVDLSPRMSEMPPTGWAAPG